MSFETSLSGSFSSPSKLGTGHFRKSFKNHSEKTDDQRQLEASKAASNRIFFEQGIIGFGNHQEYILAPAPKEVLKPFQVLIHAQNPNIHFLLIHFEDTFDDTDDPLTHPIRKEVATKMGMNPASLEGYYLVTSSGKFPHELTFSINKRAPLFIDPTHQKGGQYIMTSQELPLAFVLTSLSNTIRERLLRK